MKMEVFSYIHPLFKIATSQSDGLGMKNVVKLCVSDMSRSSGVFAMELHCEFWYGDFRSRLPEIVFTAISLPLNEVLESMTIEYFLYFPLHFSINDYGQWVVLRYASYNQVIQDQSKLYYVEHWIELLHPVLLSLSFDDSRTTQGEYLGRTQWSSLLDLTTYLYYFTSGCALLLHDHMSFQNVL